MSVSGANVQRIKELDGIRALAILLVLGCHYQGFAQLFHGLPEFGWLGVDIFFVLSGYLITTILLGLRNQLQPYKTFYARRAVRIFPPYYAVTVLTVLVIILVHRTAILSPAFLLSQVLFLQGFSGGDLFFLKDFFTHLHWYVLHPPALLQNSHNLPLGVSGLRASLAAPASTFWSLSVEEYFYVVWAPVVLRCTRQIIVGIGITVCLVELILRAYYPGFGAYFGVFFRLDTLIYGALLALLLERWKKTGIPARSFALFAGAGCAALVAVALILFRLRPFVGREIRSSPLMLALGLTFMSIAIASLLGLLILRANTQWAPARLLRLPALQYLGTISYTMYLTHMLVAFFVLYPLARLAPAAPMGAFVAAAVLSSIMTVAVARASWHFLEKPLLRWKDRRFPGVRLAEPRLD